VPVASWRAGTGSVPAWNQFNAAPYHTPCSRAHSFTFTRTEQRKIHQYDSQHGTTTNPRPQTTTEVYNAFARPAGAPRIAVDLPGRLAKPLGTVAALARAVPGARLAATAAADALDIPPELLRVATFAAVFDSTVTHEALAGSGLTVPPLEDYAGALWRYWRQHLDPQRAARHGPRGELDGRRVVITGASSGIGRATAFKVAAAGGTPLLVARRAAELEQLRGEIAAAGGTACAYPADLTDPDAVDEVVERMLAEHDGIEMLVNSAGRSIRRSIRLSYDRFHDFERAMAINCFAAVRLILALLPHMTERRFGHIVNVSSIGVEGIAPRFAAYVASKAALDYFSRIAATETRGAGVTFTTVHMPLVRTPMISPTKLYDAFPTKTPDEAAKMIVDALARRPKHLGTPIGAAIGLTYALSPGLVDAIAHQAYRVFPDSTAAGGAGSTARLAVDRRLTGAGRALVTLTRGFHW
jgi:NAD(P)-dependent dehydrogenase (short-subunit alcohol dehydrogenase family)